MLCADATGLVAYYAVAKICCYPAGVTYTDDMYNVNGNQ